MSLFRYEAMDARGRIRRGEIEAATERAARQTLKERGLAARRLSPAAEAREPGQPVRGGRLREEEVALFLEQLAALTEAGMPLAEALAAIAEGAERPALRRALTDARRRVLEGESFAAALRAQGLGDVVCNMVAAGEETGQLEAVAARLAGMLERRRELRQEMLSATLYPAIVMGFGVLVMMFLLAAVVPRVVGVFAHAGAELPWLTRAVISLSAFLRHDGLWLAAGAAALTWAWRLASRRPDWRKLRDAWLLRLPVAGSLLVRLELARYARTLGMLLAGGVPALEAMHIANQGWSLAPLREVGARAREAVREGGSLAEALAASPIIPPLAARMARVGEQSGKLDSMLLKLAAHYETETMRRLKRMVTVAEPLLVLVMAAGVGALAMAILLPIVQMNELVR